MIKNYLSHTLKHLKKHKGFSFINILGLTAGISCCFMIFLFIVNELNFDNFHSKAKDIYRVYRVGNNNGERREIPYLSPPYAPALQNDFPDAIAQSLRIMQDNDLISYKNISFNEKNILLTDDNFFSFFDFKLIRGEAGSVLKNPNSIVLTRSTAERYFGKEDPIGKVLEFNKDQQLTVTGITEDVTANSHLQFDMIIPIQLLKTMSPTVFENWPNNSLYVYVQLKPGVTAANLENRFPAFMDKYMGGYFAKSGFKMDLSIKPLKDVYFAPDAFDSVKHGNKKMVYIFMSIAVLILIIACINFINLATAKSTERAKEVGLRKTLGAVRQQLIGQFMIESFLFATVACLLSIGIVQALMPAYNSLLGYTLPSFWTNIYTIPFFLGVIIIVGLLAGSYPALLLSSFKPIESLKGKLKLGKSNTFFRKGLVIFQFGISVLLIICVVTIMRQMHYLQTADLGFDKEQTLIVRFDNLAISGNKISFKRAVEQLASVQHVSSMSGEPGGFYDSYSFEAPDKPGENYFFNTEFTDFDFAKTLGLQFIAGRDFSTSYGTDSANAVIVNRNAARVLGYTPEQAIGKQIKNVSRDSLPRTIVGVVENYHYASLKDEIGSLVISPGNDKRLALIKLKTGNVSVAVSEVKKAYALYAADYPFEYKFLDDRFNTLYKTEASQQTVLTIFSSLAIFIACLGLFGLASYSALKRTKEIGVRKVLGSSVSNIVLLLSKELMQPVLIGTLIVLPLGYYLMSKWLQNFTYRINIEWWMFAVAILTSLMIAFITISIQSIKAAIANPIKSLRTE